MMKLDLYPTPTTTANLTPTTSPTPTHTIAFTTPNNYATRLRDRNWTPLWCPTVDVTTTPATRNAVHHHLLHLDDYSAVAFTSRALSDTAPLAVEGEEFIVAALGNDAEVLTPEFIWRVCRNLGRVKVVVPTLATPSGLVESLGVGFGRRVLCPVPLVLAWSPTF